MERNDQEELREVYRPLARSVASHYAEFEPDIDELTSVALETLPRAAKNFLSHQREELTYRFDTYLTYYFVKAVERSLED